MNGGRKRAKEGRWRKVKEGRNVKEGRKEDEGRNGEASAVRVWDGLAW
jgi:hypothetical protein